MNILLNYLKKWMLVPFFVISLFSCHKPGGYSPIVERTFNITGFNKIYAGDRFNLAVTHGNEFSIVIKGHSHDVEDVEMSVANNILEIQYANYESTRTPVDVVISLPQLVQVNLSAASTGVVNGFQGMNNVIRTVLSGASHCTLNGAGINVQVDISGSSELVVTGATENLYGNVSGSGRLKAYNLTATEVDLAVSGASQSWVKVVHTLYADVSGGSRLYYKGNPAVKNVVTSGGGEVIHE